MIEINKRRNAFKGSTENSLSGIFIRYKVKVKTQTCRVLCCDVKRRNKAMVFCNKVFICSLRTEGTR